MIAVTLFSTILVLALWLPSHGNIPIILFAAIYGFSSGTAVSFLPALVAQISDIREIGIRNGANFLAIAIAVLIGNPIAGALVDRDGGGYLYLQLFCGLVMAGGSALYFVARTLQAGLKWQKI